MSTDVMQVVGGCSARFPYVCRAQGLQDCTAPVQDLQGIKSGTRNKLSLHKCWRREAVPP